MKDIKVENKKVEIWKDIKGYKGLYQVSSWGNIKSFVKNKNGVRLVTYIDTKGYSIIILTKNKARKNFRIHRLVGLHFINNVNDDPIINHLDGDKLNNYYKNLEWTTYAENNKHAWRIGLYNKNKTKNKRYHKYVDLKYSINGQNRSVYSPELNMEFYSIAEANRITGINSASIIKCCKGKRKSAGTHPKNQDVRLTWKYANNKKSQLNNIYI